MQEHLGLSELPVVQGDSQVAVLMLRQAHEENHSRDPKQVLARSRKLAWIIRGRSTAAKIIKDCATCHTAKHTAQEQIMGSLPPNLPRTPHLSPTPQPPMFVRCAVAKCFVD